MIPVEVTPATWHFTSVPDALDHWQTLVAGLIALAAAWLTIRATKRSADTTVRLDKERRAREASAFYAMLAEAMKRVIAEAQWAKVAYREELDKKAGSSPESFTVRQCITKGAFAELRAACVRQGSPLTGAFLNLEREIDNFAQQHEYNLGMIKELIPSGKRDGMSDQLDKIEKLAAALHEAVKQFR